MSADSAAVRSFTELADLSRNLPTLSVNQNCLGAQINDYFLRGNENTIEQDNSQTVCGCAI
jgi:hypothetical protein